MFLLIVLACVCIIIKSGLGDIGVYSCVFIYSLNDTISGSGILLYRLLFPCYYWFFFFSFLFFFTTGRNHFNFRFQIDFQPAYSFLTAFYFDILLKLLSLSLSLQIDGRCSFLFFVSFLNIVSLSEVYSFLCSVVYTQHSTKDLELGWPLDLI